MNTMNTTGNCHQGGQCPFSLQATANTIESFYRSSKALARSNTQLFISIAFSTSYSKENNTRTDTTRNCFTARHRGRDHPAPEKLLGLNPRFPALTVSVTCNLTVSCTSWINPTFFPLNLVVHQCPGHQPGVSSQQTSLLPLA